MAEREVAAPLSHMRLVALALGTQAALVGIAIGGGRLFGIAPRWGDPVTGVLGGLALAVGLAASNYALLAHGGGEGWFGVGVRAAYREVLAPLFKGGSLGGSLLIGAAAGIGEEWLFRGLLQPLVGWVGASVLFGLAHVGGRRLLALGAWASLMGMVLGGLATWSGGLIAPMVAHGVYDALALEYIRRTAGRMPGAGHTEEQATS